MAVPRGRARCSACGRALAATHKFCPNCGVRIRTAPPVPATAAPALQVTGVESARLEEERRLVTVLFADLSGSTTLGERLDPEDLREVLGTFFGALAREIQRFGGIIDKYIGDAVMAVFGAPIAREDDPHRAIRAALAIQAALARQNDTLQQRYGVRLALRIGVNTGDVVAGLMAGEVASAYMVTGDTVNTAQRLETAAPPGEVLAGELTYRLTRRTFRFEAIEPLALKGKAQPVAAYRVLGRSEELLDRDAPPFVGREAELARLDELLTMAMSGRGQLVHIHGEAGVGKTRLLHEFLGSLPETFSVVRARCLSHETATPYGLLADVMRRAFRIQQGDSEESARAVLRGIFAQLGETADDVAAGIFLEVLGHGSRTSREPEVKRRILVSVLRRFIRQSPAQEPLLLVAEDAHWMDSASAAVLREVGEAVGSVTCLLVTTSREPAAPWPAEIVALQPLDEVSAETLLDRAAGAPLDPKLRSLVLERTGGNPFFIGEVVRNLATQKTVTVPATVQELLAARLDGLDPGPRRVAQRASVIGRTFSTRLLAQLARDEPLEPALATLEKEAFIAPRDVVPEPTYSFRHALMQEVAYEGQLRSQRRVLHGQVGGAIEELYRDRLDESVDVLAFHYDRSENDEKALIWLVRAGDRATALFANDEALASYGKALKRAQDGEGPLAAGMILERIGDVQTHTSRYDEALATLRAARDRMPSAAPGVLARLHRKVGMVLGLKSQYPEAFAEYGAGLDALRDDSTNIESALIAIRIGALSVKRGDYAAARESLARAIETGKALQADGVLADGLKNMGLVCFYTGDLKGAHELFERSRAIYERLEDLYQLADVRQALGATYRRLGRWKDALAEYVFVLAVYERIGHPQYVGRAHNNLGVLHRLNGNLAEAIQQLQKTIEIYAAIGHVAGVALALVELGAARADGGDLSGGRADLLEAEVRFERLGITAWLPELYQYLAQVELAAGDLDAAARAADQALEVSLAAQALQQQAMSKRVLGEVALARGDAAAARALLEESRLTLAQLGEVAELARTEAVLRKLDGAGPLKPA